MYAIRSYYVRYGGKVIGICGGLQMLGMKLNDPLGLEGASGSAPGLGLFDYETTLAAEKNLENVTRITSYNVCYTKLLRSCANAAIRFLSRRTTPRQSP